MSNPVKVYADNIGHTHAAACQAVYDVALADAHAAMSGAAADAINAAAGVDVAALQSENTRLQSQVAAQQEIILAMQMKVEGLIQNDLVELTSLADTV